jgi:hypothetical protein
VKLASGLKIADPCKLILAFVEHWYPMYDGVQVLEDNELRVTDIALSTMLNSQISGNTAGVIFRERKPIEDALAGIPPCVDLLDVGTDGEIPGASGISRAITSMCDIKWVKLSVSTKILHKKRPGLIPIFDSVVESQYYPRWCPSVRGRLPGDYALALIKVVHKDIGVWSPNCETCRASWRNEGRPLRPAES